MEVTITDAIKELEAARSLIAYEGDEYIDEHIDNAISLLRATNSTPAPDDVTMAVLKRIGDQPEFREAWKNMLNAERNYLCGDLYNIIYSLRVDCPYYGRHQQCKIIMGEPDCKTVMKEGRCPLTTHSSIPALESDVDCYSCKFGEQCRKLSYIPPCYNHGPDSPAAAAKAERDRVLGGLQHLIDDKTFRNGKAKPCMMYRKDLIIFIESLRSKQEEQEDE